MKVRGQFKLMIPFDMKISGGDLFVNPTAQVVPVRRVCGRAVVKRRTKTERPIKDVW